MYVVNVGDVAGWGVVGQRVGQGEEQTDPCVSV